MSTDQQRILLVDDSKLIRRLAVTLLTPAGYEIREASGPQQALQLLTQEDFDLVIMDIMMPGMSGLDVARKIRSTDKLKDLPILFCTSVSDRDTVLDAANLAPMDYVTKPLNRQVLLEKTKPLIEKKLQSSEEAQTEEAT